MKKHRDIQSSISHGEEARSRSFPPPLEGTSPAGNLILGFYLPGLRDNTFLLVEATWFVVCCYGSPRTKTTESHVSITVLGPREKNTHIYDTHVEKKNKSTPGGVELA